ncbi:hypothetical protein UlMin_011703 [Ulmus minor]
MIEALQITKDTEDITDANLVGKYLPCYEMWELFIKLYSLAIGISMRICRSHRNDERGLWRREWVCSRQGYRHERLGSVEDNRCRKKEVTRCGCKATFHVLKEFGQEMWRATIFIPEHNHPLTAKDHLRFLRSNCKITEAQTAQIQTYRLAGIKICDIVNLMVQQSGGYRDLGFTKKDCYNKVADLKHSMLNETDAEGLLGYLEAKMDSSDPTLFAKYAVDDEDRLCHIFWSDTASQRDYACFSYAFAFDTTYRTNAFNKPLVIFVGVNHHFRTTTYVWVLQTLLECMNGVIPGVVVTDGDNSMKATIQQCFLGSVHRLCGWHLCTNATSNVKSPQFTKAFKKLLYRHYNFPQWCNRWNALLQKFDLHSNAWVNATTKREVSG